jgi:hypothetical protein
MVNIIIGPHANPFLTCLGRFLVNGIQLSVDDQRDINDLTHSRQELLFAIAGECGANTKAGQEEHVGT